MMADNHIENQMGGFYLEQGRRGGTLGAHPVGAGRRERAPLRPVHAARRTRGENRCGADIKPLPITWLWPGWVPAGKLTILAGAAGTGKTTLALALAAVLTAGGRWPDGSECKQLGNVLIWSSEDVADDTLVPRLIASGADLARCHFIEGIAQDGESVPFDPSQDIADLRRAVDAIGGVSLLLIDPIVSAVAGDMHRAQRRAPQPAGGGGLRRCPRLRGYRYHPLCQGRRRQGATGPGYRLPSIRRPGAHGAGDGKGGR